MHGLLAALLWWSVGAHAPAGPAADVVLVDRAGAVSLAHFDCVAIARSAVVSRVCHDARRDVAIAEVAGRHRAWCGMPRALVDEWLAAPSMGRFLEQRIGTAHRCPPGEPRAARGRAPPKWGIPEIPSSPRDIA